MSTSTRPAVDEIREAFDAYEEALRRNDVEGMNELFWDSEDLVRFGTADEQWGFAALQAWRAKTGPIPDGRELSRTRVAVLDDRTAIVTTLFTYPGRDGYGRQSQTWFRFPVGWRIVSAHVSEIDRRPPWK